MTRLAWAAALLLVLAGVAVAETPRRGGTIRMTAPYGTSFSSMDLHTTQRAQDDIYGKAIHRTLYNWDSTKNDVVLELATAVTTSADGLVHTYKLRDDAFFHNGKKLGADDVIYTYTRIMDGKRAFPGARYCRIIKGAIAVEKGEAQAISGLRKIDDLTLEITLTERVNPGYYF